MAIIRAFDILKTKGRNELTEHGYIDDAAAGGEIVLTAERVKITTPPTVPTKSGIISTLRAKSISISILNEDGSDLVWTTKPEVLGISNPDADDPAYGDGEDLVAAATKGSFGSTLKAGKQQMIQVDPDLCPYGIMVRAEAPAQNLDLLTRVLYRTQGRR